jgi:hypothetical protein
VEGNNVRIVQDGPDDEPGPSNLARRWRLATVAAIGLVVVALVFVPALRSTDDPLTTPLEAFPAATTTMLTTTTTAQPITATTIAGQTIRDAGAYIQPRVEALCQRAIAARPDGLQTPDQWFGSNHSVFNVVQKHLRSVYIESGKARNATDGPLLDALALVIADLEDIQEALGKVFDAVFREGTDDWTHQFTLVERLCERATRNVEAMASLGE